MLLELGHLWLRDRCSLGISILSRTFLSLRRAIKLPISDLRSSLAAAAAVVVVKDLSLLCFCDISSQDFEGTHLGRKKKKG